LKKTHTTEHMVEIHEFYVIRSASGSLPSLCAECATGDALMISPEQAATIAQVSVRAIYRWVEDNVIHYKEAPGGSITVCVKSLSRHDGQLERAITESTNENR
jgi:hypothetical protein